MNGGRFDFDDGGTYCGGWEEGKAHGHGVCTGPDAKGEYAGAWHYGFEVSGIYTWPSGNTYKGQWQNGKRHGLGVESRGRWEYRGEWTQGLKGRYGLRQSLHSQANYLGTWSTGLHDGYGTETYVDGGTYKGQWLRGMRHGYGIRTSAPFGIAAKYRSRSQTNTSLTSLRSDLAVENDTTTKSKDKKDKNQDDEDEFRGGFVLRVRSEAPARRRRSLSERSLAVKRTILSNLRIKKQHSTGDIHQRVASMTGSLRSSGSTISCTSDDSDHRKHLHDFSSPPEERIDPSAIETYKGEWKNDKRSGFGICERSDGVRYSGEWYNNRKHGYGVTFFKDGTKEEGRYKNNVLVCSTRRKGIMFVRSAKLKERIEASVEAARRSADMAAQRVDIALSRTMTAQERAEAAVEAGERARDDADTARICATQFDPSFRQPGIEHIRHNRNRVLENHAYANHVSFESTTSVTAGHQTSPNHQTQIIADVNYNKQHQHPLQQNHQLPNFAPSQLYQQNMNVQPQQIHPQQHPYPSTHHQMDLSYSPEQYYDGSGHQHLARTDEEAAYLLQQQQQQQLLMAQMPSQHIPSSDENTLSLPSTQMGNSIGHRLQTSNSMPEENTYEQSRLKQLRGAVEGRSTISLSDDHYDQYTMNKSNTFGGTQLRRNRPSLTRQTEVLADAVNLNRRSTLASARDRQGAARISDTNFGWEQTSKGSEGDRGSLPNLDELAEHGVNLRREDAARLASQRRQEAQRLLEEEELLRANPLRYLYHPAFRNWFNNNKGLLLLVAFNICLIYVLLYLLTYDRNIAD